MHLAPIRLESRLESTVQNLYTAGSFCTGGLFMRVGYTRVSTDEQNMQLQLDALNAAGVDRIYTDQGQSGKNTKRPGFQGMVRGLRDGDVVVVWKLDRLGRSVADLVKLVDDFGKRGIQIKSLTEGIDTTTAMGRMLFGICAVLAEFERALIQERTKAGLEVARKAGKQIGRRRVVDDAMRQRALELVAHGQATTAAELRDLLGIKAATFSANFKGGFPELRKQAKRWLREQAKAATD
jgi:DNA invertase Pin-like site-specific DNA recombinase